MKTDYLGPGTRILRLRLARILLISIVFYRVFFVFEITARWPYFQGLRDFCLSHVKLTRNVMKSSCFTELCVSAGTSMCGQGLKMLEMSFLGLLLAISAARGWKCSKLASWGYFWQYLRPGAGNIQNKLSVTTFDHRRGQGLEMLKISFLGLRLAISAARGWKCSQ